MYPNPDHLKSIKLNCATPYFVCKCFWWWETKLNEIHSRGPCLCVDGKMFAVHIDVNSDDMCFSTSSVTLYRRLYRGAHGCLRVFAYRELFGGEACVHHSFVHGLQGIKIWRSDENHIRHELCSFQHLQSLQGGDRRWYNWTLHNCSNGFYIFIWFISLYIYLYLNIILYLLRQGGFTWGLTSRMQVRPVATTSWIDSILVPYRFPSYSPCSRKRPAFTSTSISVREVKW